MLRDKAEGEKHYRAPKRGVPMIVQRKESPVVRKNIICEPTIHTYYVPMYVMCSMQS